MAEPTKLTAEQFAVKDGAQFEFQVANTEVKFSEDGGLNLTLKFTAKDPQEIKRTPGELINTSVVFEKNGQETAFNEISDASDLILEIGAEDRITLKSAKNDFLLMTAPKKGREGNMFM